MSRKRKTSARTAANLRAIASASKVINEERRLKKEQLRAERLKLKAENDVQAKVLREAEDARLREKDAARAERHRGFAISVQKSATAPAPDHFTSLGYVVPEVGVEPTRF